MTQLTLRATLVAALTMLAPGMALAQGAAPPPPAPAATSQGGGAVAPDRSGHHAMAACRGDIVALCGNVERGGGKKIQCLKDNQSKLSAGCQAAIQGVLEKRAAKDGGPAGAPLEKAAKLRQACSTDAASLCSGVEKGGGRIARCLKDNSTKLSPGCQAAFNERQGMQVLKKAAKQACAADKQALCGTVEKGHAAVQCLRAKQAQATPGCQQALAALPARRGGAVQQ